MFNSEITTLIYYFNVYNRIPMQISTCYVYSILNEGRRRYKFPHTPTIITVDSFGNAGKLWTNDVDGKTTLRGVAVVYK